MTTQPGAPRRGRRNPDLIQGQSQAALAQDVELVGGEMDDDEGPDVILLFEGESITATVSAPVTFEGMDRYSLAGGEAHVTVQPGEDGYVAAARARAAVRMQFFEQIDEMEEALAEYAERKAAEAAAIQRELSR